MGHLGKRGGHHVIVALQPLHVALGTYVPAQAPTPARALILRRINVYAADPARHRPREPPGVANQARCVAISALMQRRPQNSPCSVPHANP